MKIVFDVKTAGSFHSMPEWALSETRKALPAHEIFSVTRDELPSYVENADVIVCYSLPRELFLQAHDLKMLVFAVDGIGPQRLYPELRNSPVPVINSKGCRSQAIAEHAFSLLLACSRKIIPMGKTLTPEGWWGNGVTEGHPPMEISGKTIGILGLGNIGKRVAKIARNGFGMQVLGMRRGKGSVENVDEVFGPDGLDHILENSDVIVLCLPETENTQCLIGQKEFALMKHGVIIINIARGSLIDTQELVSAIKSGKVAAAGLDVFEKEPLPADSPLRTLPQVVATPHAAGVTPHFWERFIKIIIENVKRLESGEQLLNITDKVLGY